MMDIGFRMSEGFLPSDFRFSETDFEERNYSKHP